MSVQRQAACRRWANRVAVLSRRASAIATLRRKQKGACRRLTKTHTAPAWFRVVAVRPAYRCDRTVLATNDRADNRRCDAAVSNSEKWAHLESELSFVARRSEVQMSRGQADRDQCCHTRAIHRIPGTKKAPKPMQGAMRLMPTGDESRLPD